MNNDVKTTRVNLDGLHSLDIAINKKAKTVLPLKVKKKQFLMKFPKKKPLEINKKSVLVNRIKLTVKTDRVMIKFIQINKNL